MVAQAARADARILPSRDPNSIFSRITTILACMPIENWWTKALPLAEAMSISRILPCAKASTAASSVKGIPRLRANRFIVPAGRTASALRLSFRAEAAAEMVPSPPPARTTPALRDRDAFASASTTSLPSTMVTSSVWPAASSVARMRWVNASRSVVRKVPPSLLRTARKCMRFSIRKSVVPREAG